jgi:aminopeptidase N
MVTCKWWDQIWLNEGFATWGEFLLPEFLYITQNMEFHHLFNIKKTQNAMKSDSLQSTRPMTHPTSTNAEISSRFDRIAYDKCEFSLNIWHLMTFIVVSH